MGDVGETFKAMKEQAKAHKANRDTANRQLLDTLGIKYTETSLGCLKMESSKYKSVMFYPGTGQLVWYSKGKIKRSRNPEDFRKKFLELGVALEAL